MAKHVIELNGQKYDATTGKPVAAQSKKAASLRTNSEVKHLDGFSKRSSNRTITPTASLHSTPQKSQTLMRKVVKKPTAPAKVHNKVTARADSPKVISPVPKLEASKPGRSIRANVVPKSTLISKFGKQPAEIKTAVIPVAKAPAQPSHTTAAEPKTTHKHTTVKTDSHAHAKNVFQTAIDNAQNHASPKVKKAPLNHRIGKKLKIAPGLVTFLGTTFGIAAIAGFIAYQNMPEIAMKVASARAGLNASLPSYQPAGYALDGPIKYESGEVKLQYKSNSDSRAFDVTQKNSSWNSETLLENYVEAGSKPYQTFQANGRTIYIYDGNKATWVDGGVWYNIDGKSNLNSDQLLKIAQSL